MVEELPLYEPSGEGKHLYLWIEKRGLSTREALRRVARALERPQRACGYAGLKDARAVTRQWISVPEAAPADALALRLPGLEVLEARPHRNKLKLGHLRGNRFQLGLGALTEEEEAHTRAALAMLARRGVPNFFGSQRFGRGGETADLGRALLAGDREAFLRRLLGPDPAERDPRRAEARAAWAAGNVAGALERWPHADAAARKALASLVKAPEDRERALRAIPKKLRGLYFSAWQSRLFNRYLARELERLDALEDGAVAWLHKNGACFLVENAAAERPRLESFAISPSGPLFGAQRLLPHGRLRALEEELLAADGVAAEALAASRRLGFRGARRPLRVPLTELELGRRADGQLEARFVLPPGSYATEVFAEVFKGDRQAGTT